MKFLEDIKARIAKLKFQRKLKTYRRKEKQFINLNSAQSIGIIYDKVDPKKTNEILQLIKQFVESGKLVKTIAYIPDYQDLKLAENYSNIFYFCEDDVKKFGKPKLSQLEIFMNESFDILIDFCEMNNLQTLYISTFSKAKLKTGIYTKEKDYLDILIKTDNFEESKKNILNYLNKIKT